MSPHRRGDGVAGEPTRIRILLNRLAEQGFIV